MITDLVQLGFSETMRTLRELWCWLRTGHVYDDGKTRPSNECFWCGKRRI